MSPWPTWKLRTKGTFRGAVPEEYSSPVSNRPPPPKGHTATEPASRTETNLPRAGLENVAVPTDGMLARRRDTLSCRTLWRMSQEEIATGICHGSSSKARNVCLMNFSEQT